MSPTSVREIEVADVEVAKSDRKQDSKESPSTCETLLNILPAAAGSFVEWYDFGIYSYIGTYITSNFFDEMGGDIARWAGFGVTFLFRPLGGLVFGYLADSVGRKRAMQITIATMLVTTVLQGLLPSFVYPGKAWGWVGAVLLLLIRALQGLSAGGELATAAVYISEVSPKATLGLNLSWISVCGSFGSWVVASLVVSALQLGLNEEQMTSFGWRIPYFLALIPGILIIVFRSYLNETADFEELLAARIGGESTEAAQPITKLLHEHKMALLVSTMGSACLGAFWFVPTFYASEFLIQDVGLSTIPAVDVTLSQATVYGIPAVCAPFVGMLMDRWGTGKVYTLTVFLCGVVLPAPLWYYWGHLSEDEATSGMWAGEVTVGVLACLSTSIYGWIVELFPVEVRTTGVAVAYNIGVGVFGGFGPMVSAMLKDDLPPRSFLSAPAVVCLFCGLMGMVSLIFAWVLGRQGKLQLAHIRKSPY